MSEDNCLAVDGDGAEEGRVGEQVWRGGDIYCLRVCVHKGSRKTLKHPSFYVATDEGERESEETRERKNKKKRWYRIVCMIK